MITKDSPTCEEILALSVSDEVDNALFHIHAELCDFLFAMEAEGMSLERRVQLGVIMDKINMLQNN